MTTTLNPTANPQSKIENCADFIRLEHVTKRYGKVEAVSNLNLDIPDGQFMTLVGPSGCGKSTTLYCIAGLEEATSGEIYFDGHPVTAMSPKDRDAALVFQDYALFPHLKAEWGLSDKQLGALVSVVSITVAAGAGNGGANTILRTREGVERFMITDINNPAASAKAQSTIFIMYDLLNTDAQGFNHIPGGANTLYMDGHVEFIKFGGKAPLNKNMAWAATGTTDIDADVPMPKRMCEVCREFCRLHGDREVACGRPGCDKTWTYKTGAQLQDSLAGRRQDPIRLCDECARGGLVGLAVGAPEGSEVMPCVVPLCDGVWFYREGETEVSRLPSEALPLDRMCDRCRGERGAEPRMVAAATAAAVASDEVTASEGAAPAARADDAASEAAAILREGASVDATPEPEAPVDNGAGAANEPVAANEAIAANEAVAANDPALEAEAPPNDDAPGA